MSYSHPPSSPRDYASPQQQQQYPQYHSAPTQQQQQQQRPQSHQYGPSIPRPHSGQSTTDYANSHRRHTPTTPRTGTPPTPQSQSQSHSQRPTSDMFPASQSQRSLATAQAPAPAPQTIAGEPLHDMDRAISLLKSSKFYAEGFLMKKVEVGPDGKTPSHPGDTVWAKWFVQLSGTIMSTWNAAEMEQAAKNNTTVPPQYLNLQDAFLHPFPPHPRGPKPPTQFQFALNSAGMNRILFCAPSLQSLTMWLNAIRLSIWERSRCNEIYSGSLIGLREPKPLGWPGYDAGLAATMAPSPVRNSNGTPRFEGYLKARLPGDTEWRRVFVSVLRGTNVPSRSGALGGSTSEPGPAEPDVKKSRRSSLLPSFGKKKHAPPKDEEQIAIEDLPGDGQVSTIAFFAAPAGIDPTSRPGKKDQPICVAQHVFYASALFPETAALINVSTLFKIEGTFLTPQDGYRTGWGVGGRSEKQGFALLMLESGEVDDMLRWIVGISDAFKLYGRPKNFSFDPRDPSSLYFALPVGPHRDRQFLDRELVDSLEINESRPRAIRATFHNILFDRMRGVRPAALAPAPPSAPPTIPETAPVSPIAPMNNGHHESPRSPVDNNNNNNNERRWSQHQQQPQPSPRLSVHNNHHDTPRLPPVLSTIGESDAPLFPRETRGGGGGGGNVYSEQPESRRPSAIGEDYDDEADHVRRTDQFYAAPPSPAAAANVVVPAHQPREVVPEPPRAQHHEFVTVAADEQHPIVEQRTTADHSVGSDGANNYTAFLASDLAREPTPPPPPPPPVPHVAATSARRLDPIVTDHHGHAASAVPSASAYSQNTSDATHLSYAAQPRTALHDWERPPAVDAAEAAAPASTLTTTTTTVAATPAPLSATESRLTSPGAPPHHGAGGNESTLDDRPETERHLSPVSPRDNAAVDPRTAYEAHAADATHETTRPLFASTTVNGQHAEPRYDEPGDQFKDQEVLSEERQAPAKQGSTDDYNIHSDVSCCLIFARPPPFCPSSFRPADGRFYGSQLMAALNFVDRSESPPPIEPPSPSTVEASPIDSHSRGTFAVGPPARRTFSNDDSVDDDQQYGAIHAGPPPLPHVSSSSLPDEPKRSGSTSSHGQAQPQPQPPRQQQFPSSFAQNHRAQERAAAAQLAQQAQQQALHRPGRPAGAVAKSKKKKVWQDSDDEDEEEDEREEEEDEDESSGDERPTSVPSSRPHSQPRHAAPATSQSYSSLRPPTSTSNPIAMPASASAPVQSPSRSPARSPNRQAYLESGPGVHHQHGLGASTSREHLGAEAEQQHNRKLALNPHGLLATGMIEREERSARALEHVARDSGGTLVSLPTKPPPPQTGLVGAITSHEREKERTGGVGKALTEQQRERKLAEQRQKQLDELQRRQLDELQQRQMAALQQQQQYQHQVQMAQFGGGAGYNPMMMHGMGTMGSMGSIGFGGMNPYMMGGGGGVGGGGGGFGSFPSMTSFGPGSQLGMPGGQTSPGLQPQNTGGSMDQARNLFFSSFQQQQAMMAAQQAAQQAAQHAAQQAYLAAMSQFNPQAASGPGTGGSTLGHQPQFPSMSMMGGQFGAGAFPASSMPASPSFAAPSFFGHAHHPSMSSYMGGGGVPFSTSPVGHSPAPTTGKDNSDAEVAHARGESST
ncbi:hypothetical protein JCM11491_005381 [Sporobolomyces phaffii]